MASSPRLNGAPPRPAASSSSSAQPAPTRAVFRSADDLFAQLTLRDVARVLDKTRLDAERKRAELRELVGRHYHDLIESADAIAGMNETVAHFEQVLSHIEAKAEQLLQLRPLPADDVSSLLPSSPSFLAHQSSSSSSSPSDELAEDVLARAAAEVLAAIDRGDEVAAAKIYLSAVEAGQRLHPPPRLETLITSLSPENLAEINRAAAVLNLSPQVKARIVKVAEKAKAEMQRKAAMVGTVWERIPTLDAQWRLVGQSRGIVTKAARQTLEDKSLSTDRYKNALGAILLIDEATDALTLFLSTRELWVSRCAPEDLSAIVECAVRTARDADVVVGKKCAHQVLAWLDATVAPRCRDSALLKRSANVSALAKLKRTLLDMEQEPPSLPSEYQGLVDRLLGPAFAKRADELLEQSYRSVVKKAIKRLSAESKTPAIVVHKATKRLESGLESIEADASALARSSAQGGLPAMGELIAWLSACANPPLVCRCCQAFLATPGIHKHIDASGRAKLAQLNADARAMWVNAACQRLADRLQESYPKALPQSGWLKDAATGDLLPSLPSWPVAEFCFAVSREIDSACSSLMPAFEKADDEFATLFVDKAWRMAFKTLTEAEAASDASVHRKLQAAFDMDFCTYALLEGKAPMAFPGGIDVRACASVLRERASDYASACVYLHRKGGVAAAAQTAPALNIAEPMGRFALLPVPQRQRAVSPRLDKRYSAGVGEKPKSNAPAPARPLFGWLG